MSPLETLDLVLRFALAGFGIYLIYRIELAAIKQKIDGKGLATAVGVILAIILAVLGIKLQDVFFP